MNYEKNSKSISPKSEEHSQVQKRLASELNCQLEVQFPEIGRIADALWEEKKMIFEVQCSPISVEEIAERNQNYESLGYRVIWILHERRYRKFRITAAEEFLRDKPHYYTDINEKGIGTIYACRDWILNGVRRKRSEKVPATFEWNQTCPSGQVSEFSGRGLHPSHQNFGKTSSLREGSQSTSERCEDEVLPELSLHTQKYQESLLDRFLYPYRCWMRWLLEKNCTGN